MLMTLLTKSKTHPATDGTALRREALKQRVWIRTGSRVTLPTNEGNSHCPPLVKEPITSPISTESKAARRFSCTDPDLPKISPGRLAGLRVFQPPTSGRCNQNKWLKQDLAPREAQTPLESTGYLKRSGPVLRSVVSCAAFRFSLSTHPPRACLAGCKCHSFTIDGSPLSLWQLVQL